MAQSPVIFRKASASNVRTDPGVHGPPIEEVHYDPWHIGPALSQQGRIFARYTRGAYICGFGGFSLPILTICRLYSGRGCKYNSRKSILYPGIGSASQEGFPARSMASLLAVTSQTTFISMQTLYVTPNDTLSGLYAGQPSINESITLPIPYAAPEGPELVAITLSNDPYRERTLFLPMPIGPIYT